MLDTNTLAPSKQWLTPPLRTRRGVSERPLTVEQCPTVSDVVIPWSDASEQRFAVTDGRLRYYRNKHRYFCIAHKSIYAQIFYTGKLDGRTGPQLCCASALASPPTAKASGLPVSGES